MAEEFEVVDRPNLPGKGMTSRTAFYCAIMETATTGHAIRIALNGDNFRNFSSRTRLAINARGLSMHITRLDAGHVIVWASHKQPRATAEAHVPEVVAG